VLRRGDASSRTCAGFWLYLTAENNISIACKRLTIICWSFVEMGSRAQVSRIKANLTRIISWHKFSWLGSVLKAWPIWVMASWWHASGYLRSEWVRDVLGRSRSRERFWSHLTRDGLETADVYIVRKGGFATLSLLLYCFSMVLYCLYYRLPILVSFTVTFTHPRTTLTSDCLYTSI
jgi:hypothetical protein